MPKVVSTGSALLLDSKYAGDEPFMLARNLAIDKLELGAVGGTTRWESPEYEASKDRYDIQITGGASQLTIAQD